MREDVLNGIKKFFQGEIYLDEKTRESYAQDASMFFVMPKMVLAPRNADDIKKLVLFINAEKQKNKLSTLSITARSGGTDMTGGPLTESIVIDMTKYFSHIKNMQEKSAVAEPGVYYRDFEKETLKKNALMPSYPASREICTMGGIVANNAGGEKTLAYGKTEEYVLALKVVLHDGKEYEIKPLNREELNKKLVLETYEGKLYRNLYNLFEESYEACKNAKPNVSKNSSGYDIWNVWNRHVFDLTKLFIGSQGTLGIITEITFRLVPKKKYQGMAVIFLNDTTRLTEVIQAVLSFMPVSFESFDDKTFRLALKYFWGFLKMLARNPVNLVLSFLPEFWYVLFHGAPKLTLLIGFEGNTEEEVQKKVWDVQKALQGMVARIHSARSFREMQKYEVIRRESFNLLRKKIKGLQTVPCVDDIIVPLETLEEFLPKLQSVLEKYDFLYTLAGHMGDGNFHIIPLMKLADKTSREKIIPLMNDVYDLVLSYGGSLSAEHNDGLLRSSYLIKMYGVEVYEIFKKIKNILDPLNIFNPGKKISTDQNFAKAHIKKS